MKKLLFLLFPVFCFGQVSNLKNIKLLAPDSMYEAFGFMAKVKTDTIVLFDRIGKTHITGGNNFYRKYAISSGLWGDTVRFSSGIYDARDCYGLKMDNDSIVVFTQRKNAAGVLQISIMKCDTNMIFSNPVPFDTTVLSVIYPTRFIFEMTKGDTAGYYEIPLIQWGARRRITLIATKDYWNTYYEKGVIYDGTVAYSETSLANLGNGKRLTLRRHDQSGTLTGSESSNYGANFTLRVASNLYWYITNSEIPFLYAHNDSLFDVLFECRDARSILISKDNTVSKNFGNAIYNAPEIYAYNWGGGNSNQSLGYPIEIGLDNKDSIRLIVYFKQFNNNRSNVMYTRDDMKTDPDCIPLLPLFTISGVSATSFRVDINNFTDKQKENIRWMEMDMAYDSLFTNIVTCKYRIPTSGAYPAVPIHNIRMVGFWDTFNGLVTGTNYWLRVRTCNYKGCSDYSVIKQKTL